jgi:hypothetical protein
LTKLLAVALLLASAVALPASQQPAQPFRAVQSYPVPAADDTGFTEIFDGRTLKGWEGDPKYWRVENGAMVGEVTPDTLLKENSFIVWRGGVTRDFELKVDYRISAQGNSGINYRSTEVAGTPWAMRGYQADIDGAGRWSGQVYEERGRTFLALRGQITHATNGARREIIGLLGDTRGTNSQSEDLKAFVKDNDWNRYHLIVRGNTIVHLLNGHVMSVVIDDDTENRRAEGLLGVQVHTGPPMKIEYRNFRLKPI